MPSVGMICLPPLVFREDDDGDRLSDQCSCCGHRSGPRRGYFVGESANSLICSCGPYPWSTSDVVAHDRYLDACAEWEDEYYGDDDEEGGAEERSAERDQDALGFICACPSCVSARGPHGITSPEQRRHLQYRDSIRSSIREAIHARGHRGNPCGVLEWNGTSRGLALRPRMGFEFECDARSDSTVEDIMNRLVRAWHSTGLRHANGYLIQKTDGSVTGSYPVEFATVPCTVEEHRRVLDAAFPSGRFGEGKIKAWSNSSAGMHVHISRQFCTPLSAGKLGVWFHHPANDKFLTDLCGRAANNYCKRLPAAVREADQGREDRYVAFNRVPHRTVEVRAFRPSPRITSIAKNLELVEASFEFIKFARICETTADDLGGADWQAFLRWLSEPYARKKFYHLHHWVLAKHSEFGDFYRAILPRNVREVGRHKRRGFDEYSNNEG